ncbi:MAG: hypothetical protein F6K31_02990 [Symploca sp. SIO2G7]|nr:hypothetical protein [Symploca sp. SIO2G7]
MAHYTVKTLAEEAGMYPDEAIPLLGRLGLKDATVEQEVQPAIASAFLQAVKAHDQALQKQISSSAAKTSKAVERQGDQGELALPEKLKLKEVKGVAKQAGVTQVFVKELSTAIHNRKMGLLVEQGLEEYRREQEAVEAGRLYGQIQDLQTQQNELLEMEERLYRSQSEARTEELLSNVNFDLQAVINSIQNQQEEDANKREKRAAIVERIENGEELTEEELQDPFVLSRYDWYQSRVGNLSA